MQSKNTDYWYMASPYSRYPGGVEEAFREAARQAALFVRAGINVHCPITHTHPIAVEGKIDGSFDSWAALDLAMVHHAVGVVVCKLDGWDQSVGVRKEIEHAESLGKPVLYMEPGRLPEELAAWRLD